MLQVVQHHRINEEDSSSIQKYSEVPSPLRDLRDVQHLHPNRLRMTILLHYQVYIFLFQISYESSYTSLSFSKSQIYHRHKSRIECLYNVKHLHSLDDLILGGKSEMAWRSPRKNQILME